MKLLDKLEKTLKYEFAKPSLLKMALVHPSYAHEKGIKDNQRLEFLGDAVLGLIIAEVIYKKFPKSQEGELSKFRSALVNRSALADCARKLDLGNFLFLGEGEQRTIAIQRNSTMSDVFESVIGAVFLDGGYLAVTKVVKRIFRGSICEDVMAAHHANYKGGLQELSQKTFGLIPHYSLVKEDGVEHKKTFNIEVTVGAKLLARGSGLSKKEAQQLAAKKLLETMKKKGIEL